MRKFDAKDMRKAEKEIGANLPDAMVGEDSEDAAEVQRDAKN